MPWTATICRMALGISLDEVTFSRRGFCTSNPDTQLHLEAAGRAFLSGYNLALGLPELPDLAHQLDEIDVNRRGFGYEGAAMALALLDHLLPFGGGRFLVFLNGVAARHTYMVHVGYGWAAARLFWLRRNLTRLLRPLDPLLGWLVIDGFGFHAGYFGWRSAFNRHLLPVPLPGYFLRAFDQGLGRSLWFVRGGDVTAINETIEAFPEPRRADLWSGIGLACTYAGGVSRSDIEMLLRNGAVYRTHLAQGAAFAAKARVRAGNPTSDAEMACQLLCGLAATEAARVTDEALNELQVNDSEPAYESWRRGIRQRFEPCAGEFSGAIPRPG